MTYTTFVPRTGYKMDSFEVLEFHLQGAGRTAHLVGTSIEYASLEEIKKKMEGVKGVEHICQVNSTVNLIVRGEEEAKRVAEELYAKTMAESGIVRYTGQDIGGIYVDVCDALDTARREGKIYYLYDPEKDSIDTLIESKICELEKEEQHSTKN